MVSADDEGDSSKGCVEDHREEGDEPLHGCEGKCSQLPRIFDLHSLLVNVVMEASKLPQRKCLGITYKTLTVFGVLTTGYANR